MTDKKVFDMIFISVVMLFCGSILIFFNQYHTIGEIKFSNFLYVPWLIAEILIAFFIEFILIKSRRNIDLWLFPCAFFLANFGLLILGRLEYSLIIPQIRWIILGMIIFFITFRFELFIRKTLNYKYFLGIVFLLLLLLTLFLGLDINGISNSVALGSIRFQPLEFAKIIFVFFLASYLGNYKKISDSEKNENLILPFFVFIFAVVFLLFIIANNFGNALIFFCLSLIMTYVKTENKFFVVFSVFLFFITIFICYYTLPNIKTFFDIWLNPWTVSNEYAEKIIQSLFALGEGGIWGAGFTAGHSDFILEAHNNFIFSAIVEEFGLIGSVFLIIIYILLFYQCVCVAFKLKNDTEILLAFGIGVLFFLQMFINVCYVANILPITNTFLPFVGYGGSAIVSDFIMLGIIVSLSRKEIFNDRY